MAGRSAQRPPGAASDRDASSPMGDEAPHGRPLLPTGGRPDAIAPGDVVAMRRALLDWYARAGRVLPFRGATDPWAILVSEAMAQQTQASRAGEAWSRFIRMYPSPTTLAAASPADVLRAWRGLGYNRRALALRAAAIAIVTDHGGRVPDDLALLERLPGVGPYTARAVAALAFGRPVAAVDTNVRRVVTRLAGAPAGLRPRDVQELADELVDPDRPGEWTHALMDIGATVCRAAGPRHETCPLAAWCRTADEAHRDGASVGPAESRPALPRSERRPSRVAARVVPFRATSRWLRGRLVDRLRDARDGEWVRLEGPFDAHDADGVALALQALERDGLLERHPHDAALVRLPAVVPSEEAAR